MLVYQRVCHHHCNLTFLIKTAEDKNPDRILPPTATAAASRIVEEVAHQPGRRGIAKKQFAST
jgi:hypothetical protein